MSTKKIFEVHVAITVRLTEEDVDDIMSSALDSITYWADEAKVVGKYLGEYASEQISRGGTLEIHDSEDDKVLPLDINGFVNGFQFWLENDGDLYGAVHSGKVDTSNIDGAMADEIIQYALFGEVVYG